MKTQFDFRDFHYTPETRTLFAEASELGLRPGEVPEVLKIQGVHLNAEFRCCMGMEEVFNRDRTDMTAGWEYRSDDVKLFLIIAND
jgi:hypothetical protein